MSRLVVRNRVRASGLDIAFLRRVVRALAGDLFPQNRLDLGVYVVDEVEITRLNETFLRHRGVTDVITFNYGAVAEREPIQAEIFVCFDEAVTQARRFGTRWEHELVRYIVHGSLHLLGYDDRRKTDRIKMKRRENELLREVSQKFSLSRLGRKARVSGRGANRRLTQRRQDAKIL